jgi:ATP-dependent Zn protease
VVTKPEFNLQISSSRAEEGVTGLVKERPDLHLNQVIGLQRAKTHLKRVIKWLKQPELLASQNIAFPAGMLLAGPPGTGKTMLAKAVAGECELPFISLSVGDLISCIKNGTAENIDRAFKQAADVAPCIMFIDEIDTVATARRAGEVSDNNAVNVLLTHLDGIQKRAEPIFVLAATNFPQALDPALLRAGRLDEIIYCDLPDKAARQDFFDQLSAKYVIGIDKIEKKTYVEMTQGMSGAQIDKIFRDYLYRISTEDGSQQQESAFMPGLFREAIINISYGSANPDKTLSAESKIQVAWHEAGHLLLTKLLLPQHAIKFATIEPRNHAYGFISIQRDEGVGSNTASEVRAHIAVAMAGREAERLRSINYDVTDGAVGDIETATRYAMHAVCDWGLDPEFGQINASVLNYQTISADMQQLAEQRIRYWLDEGRQTAAKLLNQHRPLLESIAEQLIESESLYEDQIADFFKNSSLDA